MGSLVTVQYGLLLVASLFTGQYELFLMVSARAVTGSIICYCAI